VKRHCDPAKGGRSNLLYMIATPPTVARDDKPKCSEHKIFTEWRFMNPRLQEILEQIKKFEKESPYNFCDRWCERCPVAVKVGCKVYHAEVGMQMTAMAHGKDEKELNADDFSAMLDGAIPSDVREEDAESPFEGLVEIDGAMMESPEFDSIRKQIDFVSKSPLPPAAESYRKRALEFLKSLLAVEKTFPAEVQFDIDTVTWYHTLLSAKLDRALAGFYEPADEDDFSIYDAVAQFEICKKGVRESVRALRNLRGHFPVQTAAVNELIALLHHLGDHIQMLEDSIR
jgi:hypothetical protein